MSEVKDTYLTDLFVNEAKPALKRHEGGGGESVTIKPLSVTENGVYTAEDKYAFSPVTVEITSLRKILDYIGSCYMLFHTKTGSDYTGYIAYSDTENVTNFSYMFTNSKQMVECPLFDTRKGVTFNSIFANCVVLKRANGYDLRNTVSAIDMFDRCAALTEIWIRNIKCNLQVGSGTTYGHLLTVESLIHLIYELRDTGSMLTLTVGSANLEKLANVYVRQIEITDEMRAEDDLVDEKSPFEVCESTDEGATLITEYAIFKNWQIL